MTSTDLQPPAAPAAPPVAPATARPWVRRALWIAAIGIAFGIVVQALASLAFEPLARRAATAWVAEHTAHRLTIDRLRLQPWRLALEVEGLALRAPDGLPLLELSRLQADLSWASLWRAAAVVELLELQAPAWHLRRRADGGSNWGDFVAAATRGDGEAAPTSSGPPRLHVERLALRDGRLLYDDRTVEDGLRTTIDAIEFEALGLSTLSSAAATHRLSARSDWGATLTGEGQLTLAPLVATGELMLQSLALERLWPYLRPHFATAPLTGRADASLSYRIDAGNATPALRAERLRLELKDVVWGSPAAPQPEVALTKVELDGGRVDLAARMVEVERLRFTGGRLVLSRDEEGALNFAGWLQPQPEAGVAGHASDAAAGVPKASPAASEPAAGVEAKAAASGQALPAAGAASAAAVVAPGADRPWRLRLHALGIDRLALRLDDHSLRQPLVAEVGALTLGLRLDALLGGPEPDVRVDGLSISLGDLALATAVDRWFTLEQIRIDDGALALRERRLAVGPISLRGGRMQGRRDADGRLPLIDALQPSVRAARSSDPPDTREAAAQSPWHVRAGPLGLEDFEIALSDHTLTPPARLTLADIRLSLGTIGEDRKQPVPITLQARASSGGRIEIEGQLTPEQLTYDLALSVQALSLAPAAPYLAARSGLALADGALSARGRLRHDGTGLRYEGGLALNALRVDERATGETLIAFGELSTTTLAITAGGLQAREVRLDRLGGRLVIERDRSVNLVRALQPQAGATDAPTASTQAASPAPAADDPTAAPVFAIGIERLRVTRARLDFADLSLALPFAARIDELGGEIAGLRNAPGARATVELAGRVDEYGEARVAGELNPFAPTAFMDLAVTFRNVEMVKLTPYAATFAGRRIESGKLSLDLQYRVENRALAGDNRVVMERLRLGERVQGPDASDLPLDLAIAILEDADGRIDLGLPVSGSLDDPQFAVGPMVWKVFTTLLTRIVSAPFRALAALAGSADETLDRIAFDVGRAALAPPEREKLMRVAQALAARPGLVLEVQPGFDPEADAAALRERSLRLAVAQAAGRRVAAGEEPGPVVTSDPATQAALEQLFAQRFGADALAAALAEEAPRAVAAPSAAPAGAGAVPPRLHERLAARLKDAQQLPVQALDDLAGQRAHDIVEELATRGVAPARMRPLPPVQAVVEDRRVGTRLTVQSGREGLPAVPAAAPAAAPR